MFDPSLAPRVFGLPPGVDFPMALVEGLVARYENLPPEALARVTLVVNTRRMARRIQDLFDAGPSQLNAFDFIRRVAAPPMNGMFIWIFSVTGRFLAPLDQIAPGFFPTFKTSTGSNFASACSAARISCGVGAPKSFHNSFDSGSSPLNNCDDGGFVLSLIHI